MKKVPWWISKKKRVFHSFSFYHNKTGFAPQLFSGGFRGCLSFLHAWDRTNMKIIAELSHSKEITKPLAPSELSHAKLPQLGGQLYLKNRRFQGVGDSLLARRHTAYLGEYFHFRYGEQRVGGFKCFFFWPLGKWSNLTNVCNIFFQIGLVQPQLDKVGVPWFGDMRYFAIDDYAIAISQGGAAWYLYKNLLVFWLQIYYCIYHGIGAPKPTLFEFFRLITWFLCGQNLQNFSWFWRLMVDDYITL